MKIAAGICEYADPDGLYRCLASLGLDKDNGFDLAIVIHGKFGHFDINDLEQKEALDQTKQVISKFPPKVKLVVVHDNTEIENRNLYLQTAYQEGCDWLLVIDSDEYIARNANFKLFRDQLEFVMSLGLEHQIFDISFEGNSAYRGPRPRLFYRPKTIKYWKRHYWLVLEESMKLYKGQSDAGRIIDGIFVIHDQTIRDSKHYNASENYHDWLRKEEDRTSEDYQIVTNTTQIQNQREKQ
jgi:glycosyltransferase involved in cell wall biosynthesis